MTLPFVRFWGPMSEIQDGISEASFSFFKSFFEAGFPIRIIPIGFTARVEDYETDGLDPSGRPVAPGGSIRGPVVEIPSISIGRWFPYSKCFITPVTGEYLNVVCGPNFEFGSKYTAGAKKNIAIVANFPESSDVSYLKKYDSVWVTDTDQASLLASRGVTVDLFLPTPEALLERVGVEIVVTP